MMNNATASLFLVAIVPLAMTVHRGKCCFLCFEMAFTNDLKPESTGEKFLPVASEFQNWFEKYGADPNTL